jgi:hypothetical protein
MIPPEPNLASVSTELRSKIPEFAAEILQNYPNLGQTGSRLQPERRWSSPLSYFLFSKTSLLQRISHLPAHAHYAKLYHLNASID